MTPDQRAAGIADDVARVIEHERDAGVPDAEIARRYVGYALDSFAAGRRRATVVNTHVAAILAGAEGIDADAALRVLVRQFGDGS